jgi:hypothetical protein
MHTTDLILAIDPAVAKKAALVFFFTLWMVILLRLLSARHDRYHRAARLPLADDHETRAKGHEHA